VVVVAVVHALNDRGCCDGGEWPSSESVSGMVLQRCRAGRGALSMQGKGRGVSTTEASWWVRSVIMLDDWSAQFHSKL
jgi:hypothetical protein